MLSMFKGTEIGTGKVIEGNYSFMSDKHFIIVNQHDEDNVKWSSYYRYEIIPSSLGQFIGIRDKNNKKIFTKDVVAVIDGVEWVVEWQPSDCRFGVTNNINSERGIEISISVFGDTDPVFTTDGEKYYKLEIKG